MQTVPYAPLPTILLQGILLPARYKYIILKGELSRKIFLENSFKIKENSVFHRILDYIVRGISYQHIYCGFVENIFYFIFNFFSAHSSFLRI